MNTLTLDGSQLRCVDLEAVSRGPIPVTVDEGSAARCERSYRMLQQMLAERRPIYGVTTGFGDNVDVGFDPADAGDLQRRLVRFHGVGIGDPLEIGETRAVTTARLNTLLHGYSAVSPELLQRLQLMINHDLLPVIPSLGSVGASGDLTPLSYLAAALSGEREVWWRGERVSSERAWRELGETPHRFQAKEALAIMNGTSVMAALAAIGLVRLRRCIALSEALTAGAVAALGGRIEAFNPDAHRLKPHPGQLASANSIWHLLTDDLPADHPPRLPDRESLQSDRMPFRLQDVYSLRCAPQVLGAARDGCTSAQQWLEIELNSSNDNPLFDPDSGSVYSTGHFSGHHVGMATDSLRNAAAAVSELLDRQCLLLLDPRRSGLPANLAPAGDLRRHGLKAAGIAMSALAAEIAHLAAPVTPHSRPTESMNQDVVSMGTISSRRLVESVSLLERVTAMQMLVVSNAVARSNRTPGGIRAFCEAIRAHSPVLEEDRELDREIEAVSREIRRAGFAPWSEFPADQIRT